MNYRHHFHAGNFADVFKHAVLVRLVRALQRKPAGLLLLDTHAGRGRYDLAAAAHGDSLARAPEWPDGIGRLWQRNDLSAELVEYTTLVRDFDRSQGNAADAPVARFYPGSPWLLCALARPQDRLALCELQADECAALQGEFQFSPRTTVQKLDGYTAVRAMLPPPERRALVLIDPPFEAQDEFARVVTALGDGLRRLPGGTFAMWYPLTERARTDEFFARLHMLPLPPTLAVEVVVNPVAPKLKGCGLVIVNPPWQFECEAEPLAQWLAGALAQSPDGGANLRWLVPEK
ncbi:MAG: 23S rRNA (adenine(2030)-N(6))-methyltransferase RlmJ [Verrucomicrobiota bacterium]